MKKYLFKISILAAMLIMTESCSKNYLNDIKAENGDLTSSILFTTKAGAVNALTGIYYILRSENYNGYGGDPNNSGNLTNRGLKTDQFFFDVRGNDIIPTTSWWGNEYNWAENSYGRIATGSRTLQVWDMFYKVINNANAIIKNIGGVSDASDADKAALSAEAAALRAYSYFWLARVYQFTYAKDANAKAVPIYTTPGISGNPRATMKEVYTLIVSDLENAVAKLPADRDKKYRINKNVAAGILAEVYQELAMADPSLWQKAIDNAKIAYDGFPMMSNATYLAGFNDLSNGEWIWGFPVPVDQTLSYYSLFSFIDPVGGYYRNIYINDGFVNLFSATDARKATFVALAPNANYPYRKYQTHKYQAKESMSGDILVMRAAEMYLIEAEALAQQGKVSEGTDALYAIQSLRDPAYVKPAGLTKDQLIAAVLLERRKELYAEIGAEFFDLKRYQRPLKRTGTHWSVVLDVPAEDERWLFQVPQPEMDANPSIPASDQNK
ncbi:RagB/SusD family nutrient uptake outer membrane protein [Chitinophaga sp. Cy-1792]|uniref:RagB/SusD family nutrient uptake outer membrane protein n=1 Tax=Chitinophaga sp. Cy-1792 TaxID=2608339 RepID=UPI001422197E|nr:RagB/SusD family nutrient uptake outer membrane protein [Chitinophaga sp. Cy-1792]NIG52050.1 RagB/SusD family nutrient uptake outer membrane protein [Chitinophaga sp. Cy-1792]